LKHGFSPCRWRECSDAVLGKIPGQSKLEKVRIIMLFEADINYMLAIGLPLMAAIAHNKTHHGMRHRIKT
jgi:hypothetical protein